MNNTFKILLISLLSILSPQSILAKVEAFVSTKGGELMFKLTESSKTVPLFVDANDYPGVLRVTGHLQEDFKRVTGSAPKLINSPEIGQNCVLIGTVGQNRFIDQLIKSGKINGKDLVGKNEKYLITTIENPFEGVSEMLVIAGSDKRGTIYGIYELSNQIGVSPWYFWADVPVERQDNLYIKKGSFTDGEPVVKYRGIFINDEAPALTGWVKENFGKYNHQFYDKVFELILRLRGNYLWPAMWDAAFYDDDLLNSPLANEYGIVMGTSHHEPMARAHKEWSRYGKNAWNYDKNKEVLDDFWFQGVNRMKSTEDIVTIGMRGDGDEPMSEESNIKLLEKIVSEQRKIISKATGSKAENTPQMWALYKEVQDYYDRGMRVPDDVLLLLCDDNWGNVRKLPELSAKKRKGGYGMYYHFDYVGGPRNYKWLNVTQIQRMWEQMNLTYQYGVDRLWVVNVGDIKPMEYPIQFFMDMAWDPTQFNENNLFDHTIAFCEKQFGKRFAKESARLIDLYTKYNRRVTPELLDQHTYSLDNYNEFERVTAEYKSLLTEALQLYHILPYEYRDAFDQLVLFPIHACANLYEMYYAVARNQRLAEENDPACNEWALKVQHCYERDSLLTRHYNLEIAGGKWNHMMDQTHIGYTYWQQPEVNVIPKVKFLPTEAVPVGRRKFIEVDGYISMEAENFSAKRTHSHLEWMIIPGLGKTVSGLTSAPVTHAPLLNEKEGIWLEYDMEVTAAGEVKVIVLLSPTLNFNGNRGLRYAVSINGGEEQVVNFNQSYTQEEHDRWLAASINQTETIHTITKAGINTLRFRPIDAGIVLQKIMVDMGGLKPSYLGAPESRSIFISE